MLTTRLLCWKVVVEIKKQELRERKPCASVGPGSLIMF